MWWFNLAINCKSNKRVCIYYFQEFPSYMLDFALIVFVWNKLLTRSNGVALPVPFHLLMSSTTKCLEYSQYDLPHRRQLWKMTDHSKNLDLQREGQCVVPKVTLFWQRGIFKCSFFIISDKNTIIQMRQGRKRKQLYY